MNYTLYLIVYLQELFYIYKFMKIYEPIAILFSLLEIVIRNNYKNQLFYS